MSDLPTSHEHLGAILKTIERVKPRYKLVKAGASLREGQRVGIAGGLAFPVGYTYNGVTISYKDCGWALADIRWGDYTFIFFSDKVDH